MSWIQDLARPDIVALKPYDHASWEPSLERMHANELPWRMLGDDSAAGLNRYPEPQPQELISRLAELYGVAPNTLLVGRGSDEAIDLLLRAFCRAGQDSMLVCPPTYGMYAVSAGVQGAKVVTAPLRKEHGFELDEQELLDRCTRDVKLVFLCSPNNPTGNLLDEATVLRIAERLAGRALVVVDEAYLEFSTAESLSRHLAKLSNLVILRTLSKAYGLAGARCGTLIANPEVIALLRKILPPYAIPQLTLEAVLKLLAPGQVAVLHAHVELVRSERARVSAALTELPRVTKVWPSDSNFMLTHFTDAGAALSLVRGSHLLVRDARGYPGLGQALRITIGSVEQNNRLLEALR